MSENDAARAFLGDTNVYDVLGVKNGFRELMSLYIKQLTSEGKWFTCCHKIDESQVDVMTVTNGEGMKLGTMVSEIFPETPYRTAIYKYLLSNFLCYLEVPATTFRSDIGVTKQTFNKMLVTANTYVMSEWLNVELRDLPDKYSSRVFGISYDEPDSLTPYVKLTESKEGNRKITCPRADIDLGAKGTRVIPLFMLEAGVNELYKSMQDKVVKVTFLKDSGQFREIFTTADMKKFRDIYGSGQFLEDAVLESYDGDFLANKTLSRGYIKVPEVGASRYDNPTRSINYARISKITTDEEPDLSFIDIDLGTVKDSFEEAITSQYGQAKAIIEMLEAFGIDKGEWSKDANKPRDITTLEGWLEKYHMLIGTVFERELCLFMLANPQWFSNFTGKPKYGIGNTNEDIGLA